jgi:hypothetical protein
MNRISYHLMTALLCVVLFVLWVLRIDPIEFFDEPEE